ncbi:MAG TPA: hypothetical protein VIF57_25725 [Polyangia bacterium]|jgi:hypothetical protein
MTLSAAALGCGGGDGGGSPACDALTNYHATSTTPLSFATDIYPILANSDATAGGCSQPSICHGNGSVPFPINMAGNKYLQFLYGPDGSPMMDPVMAKSELMMASVNAPSMQRVVASNVGQSLLAYKISGKDGLACVKSMCQSGASVGTPPCGDPMPSIGTLSAGDRTKILDWIATGAAN